jgi:hypothetical protein
MTESAPPFDWSTAHIDPAKFRDYSMNPDHPGNGRKHLAFVALGWDVSTLEGREAAAQEVIAQLRAALPPPSYALGAQTRWGNRLSTRTLVVGPNEQHATLVATWQVEADSRGLRLITNWLEVHKEEDA